MNETVFSKIIRGEIPAIKVYEDDDFLAFLDIHPVTKGHTLLIPKKHYTWIHDAPDTCIADIFVLAKHIIVKMREALSCDYVQIGVVGNEVPHFHIHLIPRTLDQNIGITTRPDTSYENTDEMDSYGKKLADVLKQQPTH